MHLIVTDSGLGGLAACAGLERAWRELAPQHALRLTYVNAWPDDGVGYNDLPDVPARAQAFDRVLGYIDAQAPDLLVIACNTLSILYAHTAHRAQGRTPVQGIVDGGVALFVGELMSRPASAIVLLGTRTTIESGVHRDALLRAGIDAARVGSASCHGFATAIEAGPEGEAATRALEACAAAAVAAAPEGMPLYLGLCCTHYGFVAARLARAVAQVAGSEVIPLDPNRRLVEDVLRRVGVPPLPAGNSGASADIEVSVLSKVALDDGKRRAMAAAIEGDAPLTAEALRQYVRRNW